MRTRAKKVLLPRIRGRFRTRPCGEGRRQTGLLCAARRARGLRPAQWVCQARRCNLPEKRKSSTRRAVLTEMELPKTVFQYCGRWLRLAQEAVKAAVATYVGVAGVDGLVRAVPTWGHGDPAPKGQLVDLALRVHRLEAAVIPADGGAGVLEQLNQLRVRQQAIIGPRLPGVGDDFVGVGLPAAGLLVLLGRSRDGGHRGLGAGVDGDVDDAGDGEVLGLVRQEGISDEERVCCVVRLEVEVYDII